MAKKRASSAAATRKGESQGTEAPNDHKQVSIEEEMKRHMELASPVAARVQFLNILTDEFSAKRTVGGFTDAEKIRVENALSEAGISVTEERTLFNVLLRFVLKVYDKDAPKEGAQPAVELSCRFVIIYSVTSMKAISEENLIAFGKTSGVFSAWPYWREFVHSTSFRLSVPPIVLPTFRI